MTEYRLMKAEELEQVLDLWVVIYPETDRERWRQELLSIPGSLSHTYVAVEGGRVISTALLWVREMNDAAGAVRRVGNVSHVATHPDARRQGHATHLMEHVLQRMEREGCEYSTLFASEEARPLYEKMLWQACPTNFWEGRLVHINLPNSGTYSVRSAHPGDEPDLWQTLSEIYAEFNQHRPLAIRRDPSTWMRFTAYKITDWVQAGAALWLAYSADSPLETCGYLIAHCGDHGFLVAEAGVREGHQAAIASLLGKVTRLYREGQQAGGRLYLPNEPDIRLVLQSCFVPLSQIQSNEMMIRAVSPQADVKEFISLHAFDTSMFWLLDQI